MRDGRAEPSPPRALVVGPLADVPALGAYQLERVATVAEAVAALVGQPACAVIVLDGDAVACAAVELETLAAGAPLVVVCVDPDAEHALAWLRRGAADVIGRDELVGPTAARRLRFARERRSPQRDAPAFATDLATGLPHRQQLIEQLSQLLALREREPAPMALIAVRISGRGAGESVSDHELLRRKVGVRLRAGVRASDVVAAVSEDSFVVLLGSLLAATDVERVAAKLAEALAEPFLVGGQERRLGFALGSSRFPEDGNGAERLLRRALALAEAAPWRGAAGLTAAGVAANDDR